MNKGIEFIAIIGFVFVVLAAAWFIGVAKDNARDASLARATELRQEANLVRAIAEARDLLEQGRHDRAMERILLAKALGGSFWEILLAAGAGVFAVLAIIYLLSRLEGQSHQSDRVTIIESNHGWPEGFDGR